MKAQINIVWFKRDLRIHDHEALKMAIESGKPMIGIFLLEKMMIEHPSHDVRHWQFQYHAAREVAIYLKNKGINFYLALGDALDIFENVCKHFEIMAVYSHQETGLQCTYQRDIQISHFFKSQNITWFEYKQQGVIRGLKNRNQWDKKWKKHMESSLCHPDFSKYAHDSIAWPIPEEFALTNELKKTLRTYPSAYQIPGESAGRATLSDFLETRHKGYNKFISKPLQSRNHCSRLSTYLAWGCLSHREVYQLAKEKYTEKGYKRDLTAFISRLHWHCHFIQKFESEDRIEYENLNRAYNDIRKEIDTKLVQAWQAGETGFPMIDAAMRCVIATGYLNFRLRATLVSFLTHHLWQPWQSGVYHLAKMFLDFEPGIHFPQFQMQAATTGINMVRIYNPVKQSLEHDSEGLFIKQWLPQLAHLPLPLIHEPWNITPMEELLYNFKLGVDYPKPIVNMAETYKYAQDSLHQIKKHPLFNVENYHILKVHTTAIRDHNQRTQKILGDED